MNESLLRNLLQGYRAGTVAEDALVDHLRALPYEDLGDVRLDSHRALRTGFPEIIYCPGKNDDQLTRIAGALAAGTECVLFSRATVTQFEIVQKLIPGAQYVVEARMVLVRASAAKTRGLVVVATGGTGDVPVAEEAALVAEAMGCSVERLYDVGVAGVHRLFARLDLLRRADAIVAVAGMDGALPTLVAGLVAVPVFAVPTSVGYGAAFGGIAPLLTMLNACAPGVSVVNIDNGLGGGYAAALAARKVG